MRSTRKKFFSPQEPGAKVQTVRKRSRGRPLDWPPSLPSIHQPSTPTMHPLIPILLLTFACACSDAFQPATSLRRQHVHSPGLMRHELSAHSTFHQQQPETTKRIPCNFHIDKEEADRRALLGMPKATAATDDTPLWKIRLQLMKPITWIPLAAGVLCGAAASGNYHWMYNPFDPADRDVMLGMQDAARGLLTMILAGPFMEGYSQTINYWYDREIDAVNEPYRPIPSGAISEKQIMEQICFLILGSLGIAFGIDKWAGNDFPAVLLCAAIGTLVGYIYSAPPMRLKQNGWTGDLAIGLCYITLPWLCGHAAFAPLIDRSIGQYPWCTLSQASARLSQTTSNQSKEMSSLVLIPSP